MIKCNWSDQMESNGTSIYISEPTFKQNTLDERNTHVFKQCNLQTGGVFLDYLQKYPSQFSTIKNNK